jgi:HK97 gp10 family phage protein
MADGNIEMLGGKELYDKLTMLPDRVAVNVMAGATFAGVKVIRDLARKLVPILDLSKWGGPHEPGALLAGIFVGRTRSHDRNVVGAIVGIGRDVWWGKFVEFGTRHARAYPFMRPAADEGKEGAVDAVIEYAGKRIEEEAQKAA